MNTFSTFLESNQLSAKTARITLGVLLLALCAQISIPLNPVPITLHTVAVLFVGLLYDRKTAIQTLSLYIVMGLVGLPVFTNFGSGLARLMGPSGGYYIGFLVSVLAMTTLRQYMTTRSFMTNIALCITGSIVIYTFGILGLLRFMDIQQAFAVGVMPFILPGIVKSAILAKAFAYVTKE